jgi:hypothetical protein
MRYIIVAILFAFAQEAFTQFDSVAVEYASTITMKDLEAHLSVLASDEYEGRETGFSGQKKAAAYIVSQFGKMGIQPIHGREGQLMANGYEQTFLLDLKRPGGMSVGIDDQTYLFLDDILYFNKELAMGKKFRELLFMGYGMTLASHNDMDGLDCNGCAMLMLGGVPNGKKGAPKEKVEESSSEMRMIGLKSKNASAAGATVLYLVSDAIGKMRGQFGNFLQSTRMSLHDDSEQPGDQTAIQTILITEEMADVMLKKGGTSLKKERKKLDKKGPRSRSLPVSTEVTITTKDSLVYSENVLGYVEGTDKKEELVVITAHYDHVGVMDEKVFNGADDDGSGTVALLELAEAFALAKQDGYGPRRSMLFMTVSGEEKGLLGSEFYSENPVFPLESTVVDLNIDMIGRHDDAHDGGAPYVYVIGSDRLSTDLHRINEEANKQYVGLDLDYTFNEPDDPNRFYYRSDHYNFARNGIPVIFYFSGVHDDYHQPGDDVEKIEFELLEKRAKLVFHTAWELANREDRIVVDGVAE